jgi:transcription-repair coupling factor (superfamily II helicase)
MNTIKENNTLNYSEYAYQLGNFFYSKKNSGEEKKPYVIFTRDTYTATRVAEELEWFYKKLNVVIIPDWETLPYDSISPHPDLISDRLKTLFLVSQKIFDILIIPATSALNLLPPKKYLLQNSFIYNKGHTVDIESLKNLLVENGYFNVNKVFHPGEFAVRGGLIDVFPMGSQIPYRIDFFDTEIESIKTFDIDTQKSIYPINNIEILPARECPLTDDSVELFRKSFREKFSGDPSKSDIYNKVSRKIPFAGMEWYLPMFFDDTDTIFDYIADGCLVHLPTSVQASIDHYWLDAASRFKMYAYDTDRPILSPSEIMISSEAFKSSLSKCEKLQFSLSSLSLPSIRIDHKNGYKQIIDHINSNNISIISAEGLGRRETLKKIFLDHGLNINVCENFNSIDDINESCLIHSPIKEGFIGDKFQLFTEYDLFPDFIHQEKNRSKNKDYNSEVVIKDLSEISAGDPVVHENHGVGRYQGLVQLDLLGSKNEFLLLTYHNEDKLYVPVTQLNAISRYTGGPSENAPLHKLGSGQWEKEKKKALKQVYDTAAELLNLYALREKRQGLISKIDLIEYQKFSNEFPFEETPDQLQAIESVIKDMESTKPMDRLICGDVGFGKTEVAMRAAFISVMNNRQVVILVPTTLLANQHYNNFLDRFSSLPVSIEEISRFKSVKQQKETIEKLNNGKIDIIIGTHRLLQKDIQLENVGLIIVDEEHRFGVRQKEMLKKFKANTDFLTLTATPIPRTLSMSLEGLRDFSIISTAPQKRLSIKTLVNDFSEGIIKEALMREFNRGGQAYFLHNDVNTIESIKVKLNKFMPEANIAIAHGQMKERDLERVMQDFHQQRYNLLLCTTIIETGIDIPSSNTIIINNADRFGLSQLHQLRGRVGRSHHQAFAYLLIDPNRNLNTKAKKRLEAIQYLEDLGSGYFLAMHDLEIRGAGEILGDQQSGEIHEIGFSMYLKMLNRAVKHLKNNEILNIEEDFDHEIDINIHAPSILTNEYCSDPNERLVIYKRLSSCESLDQLKDIQEELIDRFGVMPEQTQNLIIIHHIRILTKQSGVIKIDAGKKLISITFSKKTEFDPIRIIDMVQTNKDIKLDGPNKLLITRNFETSDQKFNAIKSFIDALEV